MTSSRILAFLVPFLSVLSGCSMHPQVDSVLLQESVEGSAALIQAQQEMLSIQSDQLEQLSANQVTMAASLEQVQMQLTSLQQANEKPQKVVQSSPTKRKSETVSGRKAVAKPAEPIEGKVVVGRNEWVWLDLINQALNARIDTGTRTSTLNAKEIQPFERNGESWVRFQLVNDDEGQEWETPLVRYVKISSAANDELDRRPVIKLTVRFGNFAEDAEFTLANRVNMPYPIQLGRDFLRDIAVVDVAKKFILPKPEEQTVAR